MKISFIMMQYPLPTQTFAISDITSLVDLGHDVTVECLLPSTKKQTNLIKTYGVDANEITNARIGRYLLGVALLPRQLVRHRSFFGKLFAGLVRRPKRLAVLLVLLPRISELVDRLSRNPPDVVHAFWGHWPSIIPALLTEEVDKAPTTSMHMGAYDLDAGFPLHLTADIVQHRFTHSASNLPRIAEMGVRGSVEMIHRGIPLQDLNTDGGRELIEKDPFLFCTASALTKDKRVDLVLRLFSEVRSTFPEAHLVVVGDGDQRQVLAKLALELQLENAVTFTGYLKRQDLFKVMCRSSFFLMFSNKKSERLPNVVKEAMYARCVCFVSRTLGIEELIKDESYGFIFDDVKTSSLCAALESVLRDSSRHREIVANAADLVEREFSSHSAMRRYEYIWGAGAAGS